MSQVSKYPISKAVAERMFEIFLKTFVKIKNNQEANQFISDLLTPTEKIMLAKRLTIAYLLEKNYDYRAIQSIIKVSTGTISSVNLTRLYGSKGYKKLLDKIMNEEKLGNLLEEAAIKLLSSPSALEKGKGTWSYLKQRVDKEKKKRQRAF